MSKYTDADLAWAKRFLEGPDTGNLKTSVAQLIADVRTDVRAMTIRECATLAKPFNPFTARKIIELLEQKS